MRSDKQKRHQRFIELVEAVIASGSPDETREFEGHRWASLKQSVWAARLKFSDKTLRELAKLAPIVSTKTTAFADGPPIVLYRIGDAAHYSDRHLANIMAKLFRAKYGLKRLPGKQEGKYQWGCLVGLANIWPQGAQVEIFKTVLHDVAAFKAAIKVDDPDCSLNVRYYEFLPIPLLRKYHCVALDLYIMKLQATGKPPPPSVQALNPALWPNPALEIPNASTHV